MALGRILEFVLRAGVECTAPSLERHRVEAARLIDAFLVTAESSPEIAPALEPTLEADAAIQVAVLLHVVSDLKPLVFEMTGLTRAGFRRHWHLLQLTERLLARKPPLEEADLAALLSATIVGRESQQVPWPRLVTFAERRRAVGGLSQATANQLREVRRIVRRLGTDRAHQRLIDRIDVLVGEASPSMELPEVRDGWSTGVRSQLTEMLDSERALWRGLLAHASTASASRPSRKWMAEAELRTEAIGAADFATRVSSWLVAAAAPPQSTEWEDGSGDYGDGNSQLLKRLVWCAAVDSVSAMTRAVGDLACACFKKYPGFGPRSPRVGNACLLTLSSVANDEAIAQLTRIRQRASHPSTRKKVEAALLKVAAEAGVSPAELEERSVPTFGLGPDSRSLHTIGGHTAELRIAGGGAPELVWRRPDGRSQKTVPAAVRAEHPYELGQLRKTLRELRAVAAGQSARVERLLVGDRVWDLSSWRQRYADHPLVRGVARRLLWSLVVNCQLQPCLVGDDGFETADGEVLGCTRVDAEVRLWHPLESTPEQVCAVRALLVERGIVQPFKQAHRENYVITDAELTTSSYSN